jgi:hypothetical protein
MNRETEKFLLMVGYGVIYFFGLLILIGIINFIW